MKVRNTNAIKLRNASGTYLIEALVAIIIGSILMMAAYADFMLSYTHGTTLQNQILSSNMAQQLIDNCRNCSFSRLNNVLAADSGTWETVPLYAMPSNPNALFQRPLLRNPSLAYSQAADQQVFHGQVRERLVDVSQGGGSSVRLDVDITWTDQTGTHKYDTNTTVSQNGIHN